MAVDAEVRVQNLNYDALAEASPVRVLGLHKLGSLVRLQESDDVASSQDVVCSHRAVALVAVGCGWSLCHRALR